MVQNGNFTKDTSIELFFKKHWLLPYLASGILILALYPLLHNVLALDIEKMMIASLLFLFVAGAALFCTRRLTNEKLIILLFTAGFIMRLGYMFYTNYTLRQHDVGSIEWNGHAGYIYIIATKFMLPASNSREFYHPPLMHILGAIVFDFAKQFNSNVDFCMNAVRVIPCIASCATMFVSYKIFKNIKLSGPALIFATTIICFHPTFIYLSASINNDTLSIFFIALTLLYTIKWYRTRSMRDIVILALAIGLGMMTKISIAIIAVAVAAVFIAVFVKMLKNGGVKNILKEFCVFGSISLPLGLWYPIRNYILFGQPLWYVLRFDNTLLSYIGDHSAIERFFSFPVTDLFTKVFSDSDIDCNIYTFILETSVFGSWSYSIRIPCIILTSANLLLVAVSLAAMVYTFIFGKDKCVRFAKYLLGFIWFLEIASYIKFNIDYPFGFTMDFRYIVITLVTGSAFIGLAFDILRRRHTRLLKPAAVTMAGIISFFSLASIYLYTHI